jgi:hypothetical protein
VEGAVPRIGKRERRSNHFFRTVDRVSEAFPSAWISSIIARIFSGTAVLT